MTNKDYIKYKVCEIVRENPCEQKYSRLKWFIDRLARMYRYDDVLGQMTQEGEAPNSKRAYDKRTAQLFGGGWGICQDFANGLSYVANMDGIPTYDLCVEIGEGLDNDYFKVGHAINFIPRRVFGLPLFIDMNKLKMSKWEETGYVSPEEIEKREFKLATGYNCVSFPAMKIAYWKMGWWFEKITDTKHGKFSPYFKVVDHWKNSHGNFDKLHDSIFHCTYEMGGRGLKKTEYVAREQNLPLTNDDLYAIL
jgi:hypothetical protein